jgi:hypothetical protein
MEALHPVCLDDHIRCQYAGQLLLYCLRALCDASKVQLDDSRSDVQQLLLGERVGWRRGIHGIY